jgi:hypothetical protein
VPDRRRFEHNDFAAATERVGRAQTEQSRSHDDHVGALGVGHASRVTGPDAADVVDADRSA